MVFKHRRLLALSLFAIFSVAFAQALSEQTRLAFVWIAGGAALLLLCSALRFRKMLTLALALLLCATACLSSYLHERRTAPLRNCFEDVPYLCTVRLREAVSESGERVTMRAELVQMERKRADVAVLVTLPIEFRAGEVVRGHGTISLTAVSDAERCEGIQATVMLDSVQRVGEFHDLALHLSRLRAFLLSRIHIAVPEREGALFSALLLGERDLLDPTVSRDMTRLGTVHLLALSGTHVVLLSAAIHFLLRRARLGRHPRSFLTCLFLLFFIVLTGFSPSVLRACFMFFFAAAARRLRVEHDSITALFASVAIIALAEPYVATSLSLWLSALAVLGILLAFDRIKRTEESVSLCRRVGRFFFLSFTVTLAASAATLPLTALFFGRLPLLSLAANLVLMPLFQAALYLAALAVIIGPFTPLSALCRIVCAPIFLLTKVLGDVPNTVLDVGEGMPLALTLFFSVGCALYFLFCPRKHFLWRVPLSLLLCLAVCLAGAFATEKIALGEDMEISYFGDARGGADFLLLHTKDADLLLVMSAGGESVARTQAQILASVPELDGLVILTYNDHATYQLCELLKENTVHTVYLPSPQQTGERYDYRVLSATASACGTEVCAFDGEELFPTHGVRISLLERRIDAAGDTQSVIFRLTANDKRLLYVSGGALDDAIKSDTLYAHVLCTGVFGTKPYTKYSMEDFVRGARILCADAVFFPFFEDEGIAFSEKQSYRTKRSAAP